MKAPKLITTIRFLALPVVAVALAACQDAATDADVDTAVVVPEESAETVETTPVADVYPLDVCVVSGEELGSMGDPVVIDHEGTTVKFCCNSCIDDFKADPAPYLAKLEKPAAE